MDGKVAALPFFFVGLREKGEVILTTNRAFARLVGLAIVWLMGASNLSAGQPEPIQIAFIDPLSGGAAAFGTQNLKTLQFLVEALNASGGLAGRKIQLLVFDNKANPQESLVQVQRAIGSGARILTQASGSAVAGAMVEFVRTYNERNPDKAVLYLNYGAIDPALTNEKCSFAHFRFDASTDMKMAALTDFIRKRPNVKKVYLINQDYSFGQSVRKQARAMLKEKRPDIEIVGDEMHPLLKINDFSPYVAKIKASGADTVITGNWAQDFALLLKAAAEAGLQTDWYTYYAQQPGGATAIRQTGLANRVFVISASSGNKDKPRSSVEFEAAFRKKFSFAVSPMEYNEIRMLDAAARAANSADPMKLAAKLEGLSAPAFQGDAIWMRRDDHQAVQDLFLSKFGPVQPDVAFDEENTGWGWVEVEKVAANRTVLPTTCKMEREPATAPN